MTTEKCSRCGGCGKIFIGHPRTYDYILCGQCSGTGYSVLTGKDVFHSVCGGGPIGRDGRIGAAVLPIDAEENRGKGCTSPEEYLRTSLRDNASLLPADAKARKNTPIARGLLDYFPRACAAVAELSRIGNEQHNPGEPMHWAREKSNDHADCIVRHLIDRGKIDTDKVRHSTKMAWRALANLELELEAEGS